MTQNTNTIETIKDCTPGKIGAFIISLEKSGEFERKSYTPVDDKSHFERFQYAEKLSGNRVSIVYDTKANLLSLTAVPSVVERLKSLFHNGLTDAAHKPEIAADISFIVPTIITQPNRQNQQQTNQPKQQNNQTQNNQAQSNTNKQAQSNANKQSQSNTNNQAQSNANIQAQSNANKQSQGNVNNQAQGNANKQSQGNVNNQAQGNANKQNQQSNKPAVNPQNKQENNKDNQTAVMQNNQNSNPASNIQGGQINVAQKQSNKPTKQIDKQKNTASTEKAQKNTKPQISPSNNAPKNNTQTANAPSNGSQNNNAQVNNAPKNNTQIANAPSSGSQNSNAQVNNAPKNNTQMVNTPSSGSQNNSAQVNNAPKNNTALVSKGSNSQPVKAQPAKPSVINAQPAKASSAKGQTVKTPAIKPQSDKAAGKAKSVSKAQADEAVEYKDGIALKNYGVQRFNRLIELIKEVKGITLKAEKPGESNTAITAYRLENANKQKLYLRYLPQKETVQLQGKESELSKTVQALLYKSADYKTAVSTYIKQSGEDETLLGIEKKLKKLIPAAFDFLSEQSKKDLIFALIDINNEETRLSDYSGLLVSPYRGLERLIYDLQVAQGIKVKMIGQGYEKTPDGLYNLKAGYRKKIQSIVYNEVMSALYTEYFEKRNFYLHSDNSETGVQRAIREKADAKKYFDKLLEIINYNCQKLREIQFTPSK